MKVFDFNIHLPVSVSPDVNDLILEDFNMTEAQLCTGLSTHLEHIKMNDGCNFLLFNQNLFENDIPAFKTLVKKQFSSHLLTALLDFRRNNLEAYIEHAKLAGANSIMFNSYIQKITGQDFGDVLKACLFAQQNKMFICIDGSYGTSKMYDYDNLQLACYISEFITKVPIVIIHSGGYRVLEAMLLALDKKNIYLDSSFSLHYYTGSSLEIDFAFAFKKIGTHRILYGSDHPYVNAKDSLQTHLRFFSQYHFSQKETEDILFNNSLQLISHFE